MKILIVAVCLSVIALTVYVIGGDYLKGQWAADADLRRRCDEMFASIGKVNLDALTPDQLRTQLRLTKECEAMIKG